MVESSAAEKEVLASGQGIEIDEATLESALETSYADLDLERLRFEADQKKKRHQLRESKLKELAGEKMMALEAASRNVDLQTLTKEVAAQAPEPSPEEIEAFYETNKGRFKAPKEEVVPKIAVFLKRQKSQAAFVEFVESLAKKYEIKYHLDPLRFEVGADGAPALGPADAPVTIVEFSDFQCPHCAKVGPTLKKITESYGNKVRLIFRQFPLSSIHKLAENAAKASLCAADQGKFWELHDLLFADQRGLAVPQLKEKAKQLGLDEAAFASCLDSKRFDERIQQDLRAGMTVGVTGTPAFFVNGRPLSGAVAYEEIAKLVEEELAAAQK